VGPSVATLAQLSQDASSADIIRSAGGVETILSAMWRFEGDEMVQEHGGACMYHLSSCAMEGSFHLRALIVSLGGISTVLRAMQLFPATPSLQQTCCAFITSMVAHDPVALESIVTLRGVDLVLLTMRMHRLDEKVQEAGLQALETMMREDGGQLYVEVVSNRGIESILTAMWQFEANGLVQQYGCAALDDICVNDDGNKRLTLEAGAIETILLAMRRHDQNIYIQRAGCLALSNLTNKYGSALKRCLEEDAMPTIRQASEHHESAKRLLKSLRLYKYRSRVF
jgi:CheY-like chemotaxis protein